MPQETPELIARVRQVSAELVVEGRFDLATARERAEEEADLRLHEPRTRGSATPVERAVAGPGGHERLRANDTQVTAVLIDAPETARRDPNDGRVRCHDTRIGS